MPSEPGILVTLSEKQDVYFFAFISGDLFKYLAASKADGKIRKSINEGSDYKNIRKEIIQLK